MVNFEKVLIDIKFSEAIFPQYHLMLKQTGFQYLPCSICQLFPCESGESCSDSIFLSTMLFEDTF